MEIFESKQLLDLLVVGVLLPNPLGMLLYDFVPQPVGEVGVEQPAWVETVTSFNHICWFTAFKVHSLEHVFSREIVVYDIEVLKVVAFLQDFSVDFGQDFSLLGRVLAG